MDMNLLPTDPSKIKDFLQKAQIKFQNQEVFWSAIGEKIKHGGNQAVLEFMQNEGIFLTMETLRVTDDEIQEAFDQVDDEFLAAMYKAIDNITGFHERQLRNSWMEPDAFGNILGQVYRPLHRIGIYVPGKERAYPSTVLMNAIPAQVAGVKEIVLAVAPNQNGKLNPYTLAAASEVGIKEIYKMGDAAAIFALGLGTETIAAVELISGSGGKEVAAAKHFLAGTTAVNIDKVTSAATDLTILADIDADPACIAADIIAQAEQEHCTVALLITNSSKLVARVQEELDRQVNSFENKVELEKKLQQCGACMITTNLEEACHLVNLVAPEHLEMMVREPFTYLNRIQNAGAIFMGSYTPTALGDYLSGCNHILPVARTTRFTSAVSVDTFMKFSHFIYYSQDGFRADYEDAIRFAEVENHPAQVNSLKMRKWR